MKWKKLVVALVLLLALPLRVGTSEFTTRTYTHNQDPSDTANFVYCVHLENIPGAGTISEVAGNVLDVADGNTTQITTDADAGEGTEIVFVDSSGVLQRRSATAKAAATITISGAAVTVTAGTTYTLGIVKCGTTATDGWIDVAGYDEKAVQSIVTTLSSGDMAVQIEGRMSEVAAGTTIWTKTYSAVGADVVPIPEAVSALRVGIKPTVNGTHSVSAYLGMRMYR